MTISGQVAACGQVTAGRHRVLRPTKRIWNQAPMAIDRSGPGRSGVSVRLFFLNQLRVRRQFEGIGAMRLRSQGAPNPADCHPAQPAGLCQFPRRPTCPPPPTSTAACDPQPVCTGHRDKPAPRAPGAPATADSAPDEPGIQVGLALPPVSDNGCLGRPVRIRPPACYDAGARN